MMRESSLFDEIAFNLYDSNKIIVSYRAIKNSIKKSVEMIDCAVIPKIDGIDEAYIGVVRCKDFVKLISNDDGAIISNLFEDNVRYFQGHNNINAEIQGTLRDEKNKKSFLY